MSQIIYAKIGTIFTVKGQEAVLGDKKYRSGLKKDGGGVKLISYILIP